MFSIRRIVIIAIIGILLLLIFVYVGLGSGAYSASAGVEGWDTEMVPVDSSSPVEGVVADPDLADLPARDRPPESELRFRSQVVTSEGEILGIWEPDRWLATRNGGPVENRADGYLTLSSGDLMQVPTAAELDFIYGGEQDSFNSAFFDALSFEVKEGSLYHGTDIGILEVWNDSKDSPRPIVLPVAQPHMTGGKKVRVTADLPSVVYVISATASVPEGNARYNFRVVIE